jgi:hypothetical protein
MRSVSWQKGVVLLSLLSIPAAGLLTTTRQGAAKSASVEKHEQQTAFEQRIERVESG